VHEFVTLQTTIFERKKEGKLDQDTLDLTSRALRTNSELYTSWNLRRDIFLLMEKDGTVEDMDALYEKELRFLEEIMKSGATKSYWAWFHRKWITLKKSSCNWAHEIGLCNQLLKYDDRNFHCWNYRRFVSSHLVSVKDEFDFTTQKIEANFSSYSAWHQRSAILPQLYAGNTAQLDEAFKTELEFAKNAYYTEPKDSAAWFYHRWLIAQTCGDGKGELTEKQRSILNEELQMCQELLAEDPNTKWILLTATFLQKRLGDEKAVEDNIRKLMEMDSLRSGLYSDFLKRRSEQ